MSQIEFWVLLFGATSLFIAIKVAQRPPRNFKRRDKTAEDKEKILSVLNQHRDRFLSLKEIIADTRLTEKRALSLLRNLSDDEEVRSCQTEQLRFKLGYGFTKVICKDKNEVEGRSQ